MERGPDAAPEAALSASEARKLWLRVAVLLLGTIALLGAVKVSGVTSHLKPPEIRDRMAAAGWWGPVGYLVAFTIGELAHLPGLVFIAAAIVAYGRLVGTPLAYVGAIVSLSVSFLVVRAVGGKPLGAIRWRFVRRILGHLEEHPVRTIIALRTVLWLTPQLNYVLAMSNVRFRSYLVGSMLGLVAPVIVLAFAFDYFLH